jgi:hypothetical protein
MLKKDGFDRGRRYLVAVDLDELLEPVDDEDVPVAVDAAEVTGSEPAIVGERRRRGAGISVVAGGHLRSSHPELADTVAVGDIGAGLGIDESKLGVRYGRPDDPSTTGSPGVVRLIGRASVRPSP